MRAWVSSFKLLKDKLFTSSTIPITFPNIDIDPPNIRVEVSTIKRVEVTMIPFCSYPTIDDICKLRPNAIAPLMIPLYQIKISCFRLILSLKQLNAPMQKAGIKTPAVRASKQESKRTNVNDKLKVEDSIEYIEIPR